MKSKEAPLFELRRYRYCWMSEFAFACDIFLVFIRYHAVIVYQIPHKILVVPWQFGLPGWYYMYSDLDF